jgi:signal transduction histidine kinase
VWRRKYPLVAFWVVLLASQLTRHTAGLGPTVTLAAGVIAAYSAAMYSRYQALSIVSVLVGTVALAVAFKENASPIKPGFVAVLVLIPVGLAANTIHTWRQRVRALEAAQQAATMLAVERERARIAYELHDVVSHNVSVMLVQAGAARKVMDAAPEKARAALLAVESGGRAAMTELRHVMGLLMMSGDDQEPDLDGLAPPPGLAQLAALIGRIRAAGVPVELTMVEPKVELPAGVDLTAYRVVQEALTNAVKYAAGARVSVTVDFRPDVLSIEVVDGGGAAAAASGTGRGLIGLRERLTVYGGTLDAGPYRGGYRVHALIPADSAELP